MQLLSIVPFFILTFLVFYFPGRFLLRLTGYKFASFLVTFSLSLGVGLAAFLFFTYVLAWIKIPIVYNLIVLLAFVLEYKKTYRELKDNLNLKKIMVPEALIIILGTLAMVYTTWNSGS